MNNGSFFATSAAMNIPNQNIDISQPIDISYQRSSIFQAPSRFRRESIAHSQGMGGVSWGSVTIGSWLKDEVMMYNNTGSTNQISMSPPPNQASYLPDLEANYCRDYSCCGQLLPTLHDLLRHYEEAHISPSPPMEAPRSRPMQNIMETVSTNEVFLSNNGQQLQNNSHINNSTTLHHPQPQIHQQLQQNLQTNLQQQQIHPTQTQNQFSQYSSQQSQHLMNSPHLSSVALPQQNIQLNNFNPSQQNFMSNPNLNLNTQTPPPMHNSNFSTPQQVIVDEDEEMCIDDPARHLYVIEREEDKPFKCPVIGCDKTYKNQNGLKYHRLHGHQNQTLHQNPDGSFSIIDPESNTPYPDGVGMEKDKPYRCEVCGKRYKNLNGLKYHRGHTTH